MEPELKELYENWKIIEVKSHRNYNAYMSVSTGRIILPDYTTLSLWVSYDSLKDFLDGASMAYKFHNTLDEAIAYLMAEPETTKDGEA